MSNPSPEATAAISLLSHYDEWEVEHWPDDKTCLFHTQSGFRVSFFSNANYSTLTIKRGGAEFRIPRQEVPTVHELYWLPRVKEAQERKAKAAEVASASLLSYVLREFRAPDQ